MSGWPSVIVQHWLRMGRSVVQNTFGHLALSHRPFYVPRGFWMSFKDYDGEPTNVREHQDAYEFFTRLQVSLTDMCQPAKRAYRHCACLSLMEDRCEPGGGLRQSASCEIGKT